MLVLSCVRCAQICRNPRFYGVSLFKRELRQKGQQQKRTRRLLQPTQVRQCTLCCGLLNGMPTSPILTNRPNAHNCANIRVLYHRKLRCTCYLSFRTGRVSRADREGGYAHEIEPGCMHAKERAREEWRCTERELECMGGGRRGEMKVVDRRDICIQGRVCTMHATVHAIFQNNLCVGA